MNAGSIHMSPEQMETEATGFENDKTEFEAVVNSMQNRVTSLCETWEGASSQAFANQFEELKPGFNATSQLIEDIASQLRAISAALQEADSQIASKLGVQ